MLNNIPVELRRLPQWVAAAADKIPLNPRTGRKADPTDHTTWGTYEEAIRSGHKHVGFVLSASDPYTIIDLDAPLDDTQVARHEKILDALSGTYAEFSQSRQGVHIICRGRVPHGVRRDKVEVYSQDRYMICTGEVLNARPITDCQEWLDIIFAEMQSTVVVDLEEVPETMTDEQVLEMAQHAENNDKFHALWAGEWQTYGCWPSQSEADFALMAMLGFYTRSNAQCRRMFRQSGLGQRDKAQRDKYLDYMLTKVRAHQPPEVNLTELLQHAKQHATLPPPPPPPPRGKTVPPPPPAKTRAEAPRDEPSKGGTPVEFPPGIIGELARYFEASAIRPVPEIALASAIGLTAGVCGRSYNISGTGLNQYLVVLAGTGSGKEGIATGIDAIIGAVRETVPMADTFLGPSQFASGQALVRTLDQHPCFVSVLGEVGITLQHLCDPKAPTPTTMLKKVLLDLYTKSGWNKVLRPSVYSDSDKNTKMVQAPSVTLLGESTPDIFYGGLDHSHILEGLIPRFTVIEYTGPRPDRNPNAFMAPPEELVEKFSDIVVSALTCKQNNTVCPVALDEIAQDLMDQFDEHATKQINSSSSDVVKHLWNRAHLKALKLAALVAVGCGHDQPVVNEEIADWAITFITRDVEGMVKKFSDGDVGQGENKQESDIRRAIQTYLSMDEVTRATYKTPASLLKEPVIPYHYLRRRSKMLASFRNDRVGPGLALDRLLENMVKQDLLVQIPGNLTWQHYQVRSPVYALGGTW